MNEPHATPATALDSVAGASTPAGNAGNAGTVDILAIAAHRDDVELTCGGTLIKAARQGRRTGIVDLTQGEMGTRGSAALRQTESDRAAALLGISVRENLALPDAGITNTPDTRAALAAVIRRLRPRIVIAPAQQGRHPDHRITSELVRDACFVAGLKKLHPELPPHRPLKVLFCITYREDYLKPTFVVDVSDVFEQKMEAIRCYDSQFDGATQAGEIYPNGEPLYDLVRHHAAHYGTLIRSRYGEPFYTLETMRVDDLMTLEVSTF
jgi:bacillithiol biosynthesis deacetylase BshB1